jgi:hypothetical protein
MSNIFSMKFSFLFFSFVGQFSFGCYSLSHDINCMIHYLPCFQCNLVTYLFSAFAIFLAFIYCEFGAESLVLCLVPFLWCRFSVPPNPSTVSFSVLLGGGSDCLGAVLVFFLVVDRGVLHGAWFSSVHSSN